jgi:hypothetical protein
MTEMFALGEDSQFNNQLTNERDALASLGTGLLLAQRPVVCLA